MSYTNTIRIKTHLYRTDPTSKDAKIFTEHSKTDGESTENCSDLKEQYTGHDK